MSKRPQMPETYPQTSQSDALDQKIDSAYARMLGDSGRELKVSQRQVIRGICSRRSIVLTAPTGYGKSITYLLSAAILPKKVVVIFPLVSLTHEQKEKYGPLLARFDGKTIAILGEDSEAKVNHASLIFATPEALSKLSESTDDPAFPRGKRPSDFLTRLLGDLSLIVFDEAHCLITWANEFRSAYFTALNDLGTGLVAAYPSGEDNVASAPMVLALSATLPQGIREILKRYLDEPIFATGLEEVYAEGVWKVPCVDAKKLESFPEKCVFALLVCRFQFASKTKGIVFTTTVEESDLLYNFLESVLGQSITVFLYNSKLTLADRKTKLKSIQDTKKPMLVVGTSALGMGIDVDFDFSVHVGVPHSEIDFLQQIGRVNRNSDASRESACYLFYDNRDINRIKGQSISNLNNGNAHSIIHLLVNRQSLPAFEDIYPEQFEWESHICITPSEITKMFPSSNNLLRNMLEQGMLRERVKPLLFGSHENSNVEAGGEYRVLTLWTNNNASVDRFLDSLRELPDTRIKNMHEGILYPADFLKGSFPMNIEHQEISDRNLLSKVVPQLDLVQDGVLIFSEWARGYYYTRLLPESEQKLIGSVTVLNYSKVSPVDSIQKLSPLLEKATHLNPEAVSIIVLGNPGSSEFVDAIRKSMSDSENKGVAWHSIEKINSELFKLKSIRNAKTLIFLSVGDASSYELDSLLRLLRYHIDKIKKVSVEEIHLIGCGEPQSRFMDIAKRIPRQLPKRSDPTISVNRSKLIDFFKEANLAELAKVLYYSLSKIQTVRLENEDKILRFLLEWLQFYRYFVLNYGPEYTNLVHGRRISILDNKMQKKSGRKGIGTEAELRSDGFVAMPQMFFSRFLNRNAITRIMQQLCDAEIFVLTSYRHDLSQSSKGWARSYQLNPEKAKWLISEFPKNHISIYNEVCENKTAKERFVKSLGVNGKERYRKIDMKAREKGRVILRVLEIHKLYQVAWESGFFAANKV